jgi:hypothetical protein
MLSKLKWITERRKRLPIRDELPEEIRLDERSILFRAREKRNSDTDTRD